MQELTTISKSSILSFLMFIGYILNFIVEKLQKEEPLDPKYKDHSLSGNWSGYRECHLNPDWLLIYKIIKDNQVQLLRLARTGSHSELFR